MRIVMLSSALSALVLATAAPALASTETALVTVSSTNPYAGCSIPGNPGTNFPDAEVEPQVAVNPATVGTAHVNIIGAWQQDRWSNGGSQALNLGASFDGGQTWIVTNADFSVCTGGTAQNAGNYLRASNGWLTVSTPTLSLIHISEPTRPY